MKLLYLSLFVWLPFSAFAALVIQVDFGDFEPDPGGNWNTVDSLGMTFGTNDLIDFGTGLATTVDVQGSGWSNASNFEPRGFAGGKDCCPV